MASLQSLVGRSVLTVKYVQQLKSSGFLTALDFLDADPETLARKSRIPFEDVSTIRDLLLSEFAGSHNTTGIVLLDAWTNGFTLNFGISNLDSLLQSKLRSSELCLQLVIQQLAENRRVLYVDTNGQFSASRLCHILQKRGWSERVVADILNRIHVVRIADIYRLLQLLDFIRGMNASEYISEVPVADGIIKPEVVVIDSVFAVLSPWTGGKSDEGYGLMNLLATALKYVSSVVGAAVVVTNLMPLMTDVNDEANLGLFWQSVPNHRIALHASDSATGSSLESRDKYFQARLIKSTSLVTNLTGRFYITESGIVSDELVNN